MGLGDSDLFFIFRWWLAIVCTVYTIVVTWRSLWSWLLYFHSSRKTAVLGRYTLVLLLRLRIRRFAGELGQIVLLLSALVCLIYLHRLMEIQS